MRTKLRLMVKRISRKYKYLLDQQDAAVELVLEQAKAMGDTWPSQYQYVWHIGDASALDRIIHLAEFTH